MIHCHNDTKYTSDHHGGISHSPASSAPAPAPRMRLEPPITRADVLPRASLAHSIPAIDSSTAVRHRRQNCRGHLFWFQKMLVCSVASWSSNAAQIASVKSPRAPTPSADDSHGVVPAAGTNASSVVSPSQLIVFFSTARTRASSDVPLGHGLSSATGNALPAPFPSTAAYTQQWGVRAPNAAPINHGTEAWALRASPQARVAQK